MPTAVVLEVATRRSFASALEWPGWSRSGKTPDAALEALASYAARYAPVVARAGLTFPRSAARLEVVEEHPGTATTDFGAPDAIADADARPLTKAAAARLAAIVVAAWATFDDVVAGAPAVLRKGPRGGGRDRDQIVEHLVSSDAAYARGIGLRLRAPEPGDAAAVAAQRAAIVDALRSARAPVPEEGKWPFRYAARRIAWHALDHAWEIEDRSD